MPTRWCRRVFAIAWALLAAGTADAGAKDWTWDAAVFVFDSPGSDGFVSPILGADRGVLHLEARYNYENLETGSLFIGRSVAFGREVAGTVVPLIGIVLGRTDGVAPGVKLDIAWRRLSFSTESEVVLDLHDPDDSFVYSWLETTVAAAGGVRLGVVGQHTNTYETGLDIQRGPMIELSRGRGWLAFYWFNLDRPHDETLVLAGGWTF